MCDNLEESNEDGREPLDVVVIVDERCASGRSDAVGVTVTGTLNGDVDEETESRVCISLANGWGRVLDPGTNLWWNAR